MGRQTRKTRQAIYDAFSELLSKKSYAKITMQEIADYADVGRSTIYSHFETKDALLSSMCTDIFEDMFSSKHLSHISHEDLLITLLSHIQDNKKVIIGIFTSDGSTLFTDYCREYFIKMIDETFLSDFDEKTSGLSKDFLVNHIVGSFFEAIRWWAKGKMKCTPEEIADYYIKVTLPVLRSF